MDNHEFHTILTEENFRREVLETPESVLVEVGAAWCGSCHIISPIIEKLAVKYKNEIKFCKLDIDNNVRIASEYGITKLPYFLFFKNGIIVDQIAGVFSRKELEARIQDLLEISI